MLRVDLRVRGVELVSESVERAERVLAALARGARRRVVAEMAARVLDLCEQLGPLLQTAFQIISNARGNQAAVEFKARFASF